MFGRYLACPEEGQKPFEAEDAELDGFDILKKTTPLPNRSMHGWVGQGSGRISCLASKDMIHWVKGRAPGFADG